MRNLFSINRASVRRCSVKNIRIASNYMSANGILTSNRYSTAREVLYRFHEHFNLLPFELKIQCREIRYSNRPKNAASFGLNEREQKHLTCVQRKHSNKLERYGCQHANTHRRSEAKRNDFVHHLFVGFGYYVHVPHRWAPISGQRNMYESDCFELIRISQHQKFSYM